jgi:hypothetical protein
MRVWRFIVRGLALTAGLVLAVPSSWAGDLAPLSVRTLGGTSLSLPRDLPAPHTLVLLAFRHADQAGLAQWEASLGLSGNRQDWLEIPVVGVSNPIIRSMIVSGMKGKHPSAAERNHLAPLFGDSEAFARAFGTSGTQIAVLVVDREGHVLAHVEGAYEAAKAHILNEAMAGQ